MITARDLLRLIAHKDLKLDSPIWVGTSHPGLYEATRGWVDENGLHITDEEPT